MEFTTTDKQMMARALTLAERGLWTTQPNPRVGCVVAHGATIVGEGWHQRAGEAHAEVLALRDAGDKARGSTVYVTLEPCAHHGRTPPCVDALVAAKVSRVVAATGDPNSKVDGHGLEKLRAAGIEVSSGLLRDEARALNPGFFSRFEGGRPWVRVKIAASLDGRIALANGESKWITGESARADVQRWRARSSAIMTGIGTVLADDPHLTARPDQAFTTSSEGSTQTDFVPPLRVILDARLRTPAHAHVLDRDARTLIVHASDASPTDGRFAQVERLAVESDGGRLDIGAILKALAEREINELQVEAGSILTGALLAGGVADELLLYVAPVLLGDTARPMAVLPPLTAIDQGRAMKLVEQRAFGQDWRLRLMPAAANEDIDVHRNH
jgi:diaminohydroxyphosphoribosylaminopyrimidine deaminase/5-amino-6-(5-phosphoribosylamino)uracil reductase